VDFTGSASRTRGVAPLSVHFEAGLTSSSPASRTFHDHDYTWSFGDAAAGVWGTTGKSRNLAKGAVAAHVYETPGSYTATLTVKRGSTVVHAQSFTITVDDPDVVYRGTATTCVSDTAHRDFAGSPGGARLIATDDLSTITKYAVAGSRILFHRGSSWTTGGLKFPDNAGPVTLGAYGTGSGKDARGNYGNAPLITVTSGTFCTLSFKQDWRIMDLHLRDQTRTAGGFGGAANMQRVLFLNLRLEGFAICIGWSHYNWTNPPMTIDQMVVMGCELRDADTHCLYVGGERLALLGNIMEDARTSHVVRVWQGYKGVISDNVISGASLDNANGRHALKFHGPGGDEYGTPTQGTIRLEHLSEFAIISDNVFGGSGPWPVTLGPQDAGAYEEVRDIIFERNRIISAYGAQSPTPVQVALNIWGCYLTVRNNVLDGTASSKYYTGIVVTRRGVEPPPYGVEVYHNTIVRRDGTAADERIGIEVGGTARATVVKNYLVSFPAAPGSLLIANSSPDLGSSHTLMTATAGFIDPDDADPLGRDFSLLPSSAALNKGIAVPVYDDFSGQPRPVTGSRDLGAFERQ